MFIVCYLFGLVLFVVLFVRWVWVFGCLFCVWFGFPFVVLFDLLH